MYVVCIYIYIYIRTYISGLELHGGGRLTEPQAPEHVGADLTHV